MAFEPAGWAGDAASSHRKLKTRRARADAADGEQRFTASRNRHGVDAKGRCSRFAAERYFARLKLQRSPGRKPFTICLPCPIVAFLIAYDQFLQAVDIGMIRVDPPASCVDHGPKATFMDGVDHLAERCVSAQFRMWPVG